VAGYVPGGGEKVRPFAGAWRAKELIVYVAELTVLDVLEALPIAFNVVFELMVGGAE
jgi:hypothetical protein